MAVRTDSPQIIALRIAIEKRIGHDIDSRADFTYLASEIERITHDHIAENTLRRIWGKMKGYDTTFTRTLDVLSRFLGYAHWSSFCDELKKESGIESNIVNGETSIKIQDLVPGDKIRIGWLPDRICIVEYQGGRTFKAIDCKNSTLQIGDSFECSVLLKHYPLFVDNFVHDGKLCQRYSMGLDNGLTILDKL